MAHERAAGRDVGSELVTGPLLARPAGANVLPLANVFPVTASPVGLSNRKGRV